MDFFQKVRKRNPRYRLFPCALCGLILMRGFKRCSAANPQLLLFSGPKHHILPPPRARMLRGWTHSGFNVHRSQQIAGA